MKSYVAAVLLLALAVCAFAEEAKPQQATPAKTTDKRSIYGLGYGYPAYHAPLTYPAAPLALPTTFVSPLKYHAPLSYPLSYHAPLPYHAPLAYHAPLSYHAPLPYHAPISYASPLSYHHAPIYKAPIYAPSLY
ncbi:cuticle protein 12.5-like [Aphis gossypii]|uniref:Cuticle protein 12.5-like n=1 Tax=Aphis craccivora TaxID=307492 RepID=A0A6G0YD49_APHCR|nr:cuticle protein 12.5-like [Aphis gossypii]KAF0753689.1 cuticle protein 12.5-like [Aphis craccivora]